MDLHKSTFFHDWDDDAFIVLDGGLATQLQAQGHELTTSLWSAQLLKDHPQAIREAHLAYLNAGAQIITTASYQASIDGYRSVGLSDSQAAALIVESVTLARHAITEYMATKRPPVRPLIAASIGPYGASLADGSEYKGQYQVSDHVLEAFHETRLALLDQSKADILACETIPSLQEARVLARLLMHTDTPSWVSFSCRDGKTISDGTPIKQVAGLFKGHPGVFGIGVNCTAIEYISEIITEIKSAAAALSVIVYPNSGERYDARTKNWVSGQHTIRLVDKGLEWYRLGAKVIGGCCRIGPEQIHALATLKPEQRN